jgi:hypothetical protein
LLTARLKSCPDAEHPFFSLRPCPSRRRANPEMLFHIQIAVVRLKPDSESSCTHSQHLRAGLYAIVRCADWSSLPSADLPRRLKPKAFSIAYGTTTSCPDRNGPLCGFTTGAKAPRFSIAYGTTTSCPDTCFVRTVMVLKPPNNSPPRHVARGRVPGSRVRRRREPQRARLQL